MFTSLPIPQTLPGREGSRQEEKLLRSLNYCNRMASNCWCQAQWEKWVIQNQGNPDAIDETLHVGKKGSAWELMLFYEQLAKTSSNVTILYLPQEQPKRR